VRVARDEDAARTPRERDAAKTRIPREERPVRDTLDEATARPKPRTASTAADRASIPRASSASLTAYRVEVGAEHGVQPGQLVGALVNEGGLSPAQIGRIAIYAEHSTVEMPLDIPQKLLRLLKRIWVCERPLRVSLPEEAGADRPSTPPRSAKNAGAAESGRAPGSSKATSAVPPAGRARSARKPTGTDAEGKASIRKKNFPK
jgi:ATP-dependent RNA helicase DeaD